MHPITRELAKNLLPPRNPKGHKGSFGSVYVYGGSVGYTGAPVYAGEAAFRSGCGLVFLGVPEGIYPIVAARCRGAMAQPIPETAEALAERMNRCGAVVIGPGLGRSEETVERVTYLLERVTAPVVLDADGINAAGLHIDVLTGRRFPTVATPHEGEFARLGGLTSLSREEGASELAARLGVVVVRKGPGTVVAPPHGPALVNTTGGDGLAKGGSGDVLAGIIAGLLAQGITPVDAAALGVWLHGRAGDLAAGRLTAYAMTPQDVTEHLPAAFAELLAP